MHPPIRPSCPGPTRLSSPPQQAGKCALRDGQGRRWLLLPGPSSPGSADIGAHKFVEPLLDSVSRQAEFWRGAHVPTSSTTSSEAIALDFYDDAAAAAESEAATLPSIAYHEIRPLGNQSANNGYKAVWPESSSSSDDTYARGCSGLDDDPETLGAWRSPD